MEYEWVNFDLNYLDIFIIFKDKRVEMFDIDCINTQVEVKE